MLNNSSITEVVELSAFESSDAHQHMRQACFYAKFTIPVCAPQYSVNGILPVDGKTSGENRLAQRSF